MSTHNAKIPGTLGETGDLLTLPGMNEERVRILATKLHVKSRADLKRALAAGQVVGLSGFTRELRSKWQAALAGRPAAS
ncbi:MAG TPA: hypothetical protein VHE11_10055 [Steroidobacteraceae bacterium]|nr:hypothetical protein [Steroidobacteraceae bacterium]